MRSRSYALSCKKLRFAESGWFASEARARVLFFTGSSLCTRGWTPNIPFYPPYRDVLCSHRSGWPRAHLAFVIRDSFVPARNKRETRPLTPYSPTHPRRAVTLHDRAGSTLPISSRHPRLSFAPSCPHMRLNQKFFFARLTELSRLLCLAFTPSEFCTRFRFGNAYGWLHAKLFYVSRQFFEKKKSKREKSNCV